MSGLGAVFDFDRETKLQQRTRMTFTAANGNISMSMPVGYSGVVTEETHEKYAKMLFKMHDWTAQVCLFVCLLWFCVY